MAAGAAPEGDLAACMCHRAAAPLKTRGKARAGRQPGMSLSWQRSSLGRLFRIERSKPPLFIYSGLDLGSF